MNTTIIKSAKDRRSFRHIKLQNDLEALLVCDVDTRTAAASLSINIGSNQDGEVEGMAHFLEHMLFMGSEKYPDENRYDVCIKENGGSTNAYTDSDHTNYYFDCVPEGFLNVLDVWAQFFICPLLKVDAVDRELLAVDSEFRNYISSDYWRTEAAKSQFMNPLIAESKFNIGSIETLKIPNIREKVKEFYDKYYSSHLMKLVVVSTQSLDEMESHITRLFSHVPHKLVHVDEEDKFLYESPLYGEISLINDNHRLDMLWEYKLDDYNAYYINSFLSHVLGHEGPGSLHEILHNRFLIKSLSAGSSQRDSYYEFTLSMYLTDNGFQKVDVVKRIVSEYIDAIGRSHSDEFGVLYNELRKTRSDKFKNFVVPNAGSFVEKLSGYWTTNDIAPENLVSYSYLYPHYDSSIYMKIAELLFNMKYNNAVVFLGSKSFEKREDMLKEEWYGVLYKKYNEIPGLATRSGIKMALPLKNNFICEGEQQIYHHMDKPYPELISSSDNKSIKMYWHQDTSFGTPDIHLKLLMSLPYKHTSVKEDVLGRLYIGCLMHIINSNLYNINCANYNASVSKTADGFSINVSGYPEKFMTVVKYLVDSLINMKDELTNEIFENIKTRMKKDLENNKYKNPSQLITYELSTYIENFVETIEDLLEALDEVEYDDLLRFDLFGVQGKVKKSKKETIGNRMYGLVQGNISYEQAETLYNYLSSCEFSDINNEYWFEEQMNNREDNEFEQDLENKDQVNSCFKLVIKFGYLRQEEDENYIEKLSYLQVLNSLISEQYFTQLRTQEQLGYCVNSHKYNYGTNPFNMYTTYDFLVQSPSKNAVYLRERTMRFVREFSDVLKNVPEESVTQIIKSQLSSLQKPFQNLGEKVSYNFGHIVNYGIFDIRERKVECLKKMSKNDLINFYDTYFSLTENSYWSMSLCSVKTDCDNEIEQMDTTE